MKRIFLTGATGVMGTEGLKELTKYPENYYIKVLARKSKRNISKLTPFIRKGVEVIWGDLMDINAVSQGVKDADIVLHVGGMVSPAADWHPEKTIDVNITSIRNIISAANEFNPDAKVVYIGSVAQYGNYEVPYHWGECGDLLSPAKFDAYAYSKVLAELELANSGLKYWVSLRQTGILHWGLLMKAQDPIAFHVPIRGVLEWITAEESGRLLEKVCRDDVPESFWRNFYNIGGGERFRLTNYEFESLLMKGLGCPPPERIFETKWFATQNFHGCWYKDSDKLESILHYRIDITPEEYFRHMKKQLPWYFSLAPLAPAFIMKEFMKRVAKTKRLGTLNWIAENNESRIDAAFGSREGWDNIPGWDKIDLSRPSDKQPVPTDYSDIGYEKLKQTVNERGGELIDDIADNRLSPDITVKIRCCLGHDFKVTPRAIIAGGHWCPECLKLNLK